MVTPPYFAPFGWYARWLHGRLKGLDDNNSCRQANSGIVNGREYARCLLTPVEKGDPVLLSVPVEGGARLLRRLHNVSGAALSEHGNWRHTHLGAIEAIYGRAPFFSHLFPSIRPIVENTKTLAELNTLLHKALVQTLSLAIEPDKVTEGIRYATIIRGKELLEDICPETSLLRTAMILGPEALLPLLAANAGPAREI